LAQASTSEDVGVRRAGHASLYVNYFEVAHNPYEFLIELGQFRPSGQPSCGDLSIHTPVAISPPYAKMLSELLAQAVAEHEAEHGPIAAIGEQGAAFDIVLRSLPEEFEQRARELRELSRKGSGNGGADPRPPAGTPRRTSLSKKDR
jgi:hypothetical protein